MNITAVLSKFKNISKFANYRYFSSCQSLQGKNSTSDLDQPFPLITDDSKDVHLDPNIHKRLLDSPNNFDTDSQQKLLKISILGKEILRKAYWEKRLRGGMAVYLDKKPMQKFLKMSHSYARAQKLIYINKIKASTKKPRQFQLWPDSLDGSETY